MSVEIGVPARRPPVVETQAGARRIAVPESRLTRYLADADPAASRVLCASDVEGLRLSELLALADDESRELWERLTLGYADASGHPLLRAEIASLYGGVSPDEVLVCTGADEAIFLGLQAVLQPGDHAVVTWPAYQSLHAMARAAGATVSPLPLDGAAQWALDPSAFTSLARLNTRALVVNFPHSPTGALPGRASFLALAEQAEARGVVLFSDEVYRFLEFDPVDRLPAAVECTAHGVSVGVMSKAFGLGGLRIGWLVSHDADLLRRAAALKDYTTVCNSAPSEILSLIALRARERVLARSHALVRENLAALDGFFARWPNAFEWARPRAGCVGFPHVAAHLPVEEFAAALAREEGVLLLPGSVFAYRGNAFRIGFGRAGFPEALERLDAFVARRLGR